MLELNHAGRAYRLYAQSEFLPLRRDLRTEGWKNEDPLDSRFTGTPVVQWYLQATKAVEYHDNVLVSK